MNRNKCKCIYYGNLNKNLSYTKKEHVIPASLGGKAALPLGAVSDQANEFFSEYEMKAVRNTFLSINRNNNGPGRRGSLSVKNVRNPRINLFEVDEKEQDGELDTRFAPVRLGFLFCGKVYMISQVLFLINNDWSIKTPRVVMDTYTEDALSSIEDFPTKLHNFILNNEKYIVVNSGIETKLRFIIIGIYNGRWFIGTSLDKEHIRKFINLLKRYPLPKKIPVLSSTSATYHYKYELKDALDICYPFIYIKTALNVLAFLTSGDFLLESQFDEIRDAIISLRNLDDFFIERNMPRWLIEWVIKEVRPKEHFIVISAENNRIEAYVSFYREFLTNSICLSNNYVGENFRKCFICNWNGGSERYFELPISN